MYAVVSDHLFQWEILTDSLITYIGGGQCVDYVSFQTAKKETIFFLLKDTFVVATIEKKRKILLTQFQNHYQWHKARSSTGKPDVG